VSHTKDKAIDLLNEQSLNLYDDKPKFLAAGHGADIASQRADDLDMMAIERTRERTRLRSFTFAIDIACGAGGQAIRLAQEGATVVATDIADMTDIIQFMSAGLPGRVTFAQLDMRCLDKLHVELQADVIICQRAIHYLPFSEAIGVITAMKRLLAPDGRLYLSASGINSELGDGYAGCDAFPDDRYAELAPLMRDKHGIHGPVCLYSEDNMEQLLIYGGFVPETIFSSPFGNIKAVARHV
jgi:SAM-dependent methyltransferase